MPGGKIDALIPGFCGDFRHLVFLKAVSKKGVWSRIEGDAFLKSAHGGQAGGIVGYFEECKASPTKIIGTKDYFETAPSATLNWTPPGILS